MGPRAVPDAIGAGGYLELALGDLKTRALIIANARPDDGGAYVPESVGGPITELLGEVALNLALAYIAVLADSPMTAKCFTLPGNKERELLSLALGKAWVTLDWWRRQSAPVVISRITERMDELQRAVAAAKWEVAP
jgi:hypothetical protein